MTTATVTIAHLLTYGQTDGQATTTGRITDVDKRRNETGHRWAVLTITDDGASIPVQVFPKAYAELRIKPQVGDLVEVTGRLCITAEDQQLTIYGQSLQHVEL